MKPELDPTFYQRVAQLQKRQVRVFRDWINGRLTRAECDRHNAVIAKEIPKLRAEKLRYQRALKAWLSKN